MPCSCTERGSLTLIPSDCDDQKRFDPNQAIDLRVELTAGGEGEPRIQLRMHLSSAAALRFRMKLIPFTFSHKSVYSLLNTFDHILQKPSRHPIVASLG